MRIERLSNPLRQLGQRITYNPIGPVRLLHRTRPAHDIPEPRPFVPDVPTFLTLIGRGLHKHASKFPSWNSLWAMTGPQLQELGIEPARTRKYLLDWMQRYRRGALGPGGDFKYVKDGQAKLRVALSPEWPHLSKMVVNVPFEEADASAADNTAAATPDTYVRPKSYTVRGLHSIAGPFAVPAAKEEGAIVKVTEGMWEYKQGRKIDGGERRRAEVQFKRRSAERRAEREAELLGRL